MDGKERFNGFIFNNYGILDEHIQAITDIQPFAIVIDRLSQFSFNL